MGEVVKLKIVNTKEQDMMGHFGFGKQKTSTDKIKNMFAVFADKLGEDAQFIMAAVQPGGEGDGSVRSINNSSSTPNALIVMISDMMKQTGSKSKELRRGLIVALMEDDTKDTPDAAG